MPSPADFRGFKMARRGVHDMGFLDKILGRKEPVPLVNPAPPPQVDPSKDPNLIRVFDAYGRELFITKQAWRDSVLLGHLRKVWDDPNALYSTIVQALQDGFGADMIEPAERLAEIDPDQERGAVVLANVYREQNRREDSAMTLRRYINLHGETGLILTNLAKVQNDKAEQLQTLWHALELDPNQENALGWYEVIHRESGGTLAAVEALRRISSMPGSWRAQLWLARVSLEARDLSASRALYQEALGMAGRPAPTDLLMQMSGDLGKAGFLEELLEWTTPHFDLTQHGLQVGNNLIKASVDLGRFDDARDLLKKLYAQNRLDWKPTLSFWDTEIARLHASATPIDPQEPLCATLMSTVGPIWLPDQSIARELFPRPVNSPLSIAFIGGSAETGSTTAVPVHQVSDGPGRLSRALPLFLAEHAYFATGATVHTLQPWLNGPNPGFVLMGMPWTDEEAATHARLNQPPSDFVVITHLKTFSEPWEADMRLVQVVDGTCLATASAKFQSSQPQAGLPRLASELIRILPHHAQIKTQSVPHEYEIPTGTDLVSYLIRLEQLLAVRCSSLDQTQANFLSGEREILDGNLHLCLSHAKNLTIRVLLLQTCLSMKRVRPDVVSEYQEKLQLLQREYPLEEPANGYILKMMASVLNQEG